jgi:hypothetical protein
VKHDCETAINVELQHVPDLFRLRVDGENMCLDFGPFSKELSDVRVQVLDLQEVKVGSEVSFQI